MITKLDVLVVGAGGGVYSTLAARKSMSSILLMAYDETGDWYGILLDAGYMTLSRLMELGVDLTKIRIIFLSHRHVDHVADLPLVVHARYRINRKKMEKDPAAAAAPLTIFCPAGYAKTFWRSAGQFGDAEFDAKHRREIEFIEGPCHIGIIETVEVAHDPKLQCLAAKITIAPWSVVYTGDISKGPSNDGIITRLAKNASLLAGEATTDNEPEYHHGLADMAAVFEASGAKKWLACHGRPDYLPAIKKAADASAGKIVMAIDGDTITVEP